MNVPKQLKLIETNYFVIKIAKIMHDHAVTKASSHVPSKNCVSVNKIGFK